MKKNITTTTATTTNNRELPQIQRANLTFAQAKRKFVGTTVVELAGICECGVHRNGIMACDEPCTGCQFAYGDYVLELGIDNIRATRKSYHLECESASATFVITKERAANFSFRESNPWEDTLAQIPPEWIDSWSRKFMFCRAWKQKTNHYPKGRWYIYPCRQEKADCLAVAVAEWDILSFPLPQVKGVLAHKFVHGRFDGQSMYDKRRAGILCILIRYDPKRDKLIFE